MYALKTINKFTKTINKLTKTINKFSNRNLL